MTKFKLKLCPILVITYDRFLFARATLIEQELEGI